MPKPLFYIVTDTQVPGLIRDFHVQSNGGYAYETDTRFVHFYGSINDWYGLSPNLCVIDTKHGTLNEWVTKFFGARNIEAMDYDVGESIKEVWRPGLYYYDDVYQALDTNEFERKLNEQALRVLIEKLDEIFLYIEPSPNGFSAYSHKTRELLILACTEVESAWNYYMNEAGAISLNRSGFTTKDYIKLKDVLFLPEYECSFRGYVSIEPLMPFNNWNLSSPTKSLVWYDAYNRTKHNRSQYFSEANLFNVIQAVAANIIMHIVRFGPYFILGERSLFSSLINQHFKFRLVNSNIKKHYVPQIQIPDHYRAGMIYYGPKNEGDLVSFKVKPFAI